MFVKIQIVRYYGGFMAEILEQGDKKPWWVKKELQCSSCGCKFKLGPRDGHLIERNPALRVMWQHRTRCLQCRFWVTID